MFETNHTLEQWTPDYPGPNNHTLGLFLISVLSLFLELLLIRWITTEINIFAYLQNTVLVVCFLGLGMGCFTCRQPIIVRNFLLPLLIIVLLLGIPSVRMHLGKISLALSLTGDLLTWNMGLVDTPFRRILSVSVGLVATFGLMFFIWAIFVPLGRILGRLMDEHPKPIWAYSINIAGSLVGIWSFLLLSVYYQPPAAWFMVAAALSFFFVGRPGRDRHINLALLFGIVALSWLAGLEPRATEVLWSPYQKLALYEMDPIRYPFAKYFVKVNNTGYQWIVDLNEGRPNIAGDTHDSVMRRINQYSLPFLLHSNPETTLIVGAGTGNDVVGALRHGVKEVTAVEIDPGILNLGRKYHPERPYDSGKVKVIYDDARSFFVTA